VNRAEHQDHEHTSTLARPGTAGTSWRVLHGQIEAEYTPALRKPLTAISGYSQVILELYGRSLEGECQNYLKEVLNGTTRMNQLIDTLLNFSRGIRSELRRCVCTKISNTADAPACGGIPNCIGVRLSA
jgi:signal transduction histidine kinase